MVRALSPIPAVEEFPKVSAVMNKAYDVELAIEQRCGRGSAQARILLLAETHDGITPSQIAVTLHIRSHSVSGLLNQLEDDGLIERLVDREDRRVRRIHLKPEAKPVVSSIRSAFAAVELLK